MTPIERARLKPGRLVQWRGRHFAYHGYSHRAHHLKENNVSVMRTAYLTGAVSSVPVYEHLSDMEILGATVEGHNQKGA